MRSLCVLTSCLLLLLAAGPSRAQTPEAGVYYKLTTQFRGAGMPLDVYNGGPQNNKTRLDRDQNVTGQLWLFEETTDGYFRLTTKFRGRSMCLDINPPNNRAELRPCGNFTGQYWQIEPDKSWFRLSTAFRGPDMCLDISPTNNHPELRRCGDFTGQMWRLREAD